MSVNLLARITKARKKTLHRAGVGSERDAPEIDNTINRVPAGAISEPKRKAARVWLGAWPENQNGLAI